MPSTVASSTAPTSKESSTVTNSAAENESAPLQAATGSKPSRLQVAKSWVGTHKKIVIPVAVIMLLLPLLGLLALRNRHGVKAEAVSPGVYPSPQGYGAGNWSEAYKRATALVANMTLEEMNNITIGFDVTYTGCVGVSGSAPRVNYPGLCLQDAGNGVRDTDGVSGFASGVSVGASWNSTLAYERGKYMGAEFKRKGANIALGPVVGPIGRIAQNGRNWEGFTADPYADGILGAASVRGLQQNVMASVKHYLAYEQETNRNPISGTNTPSTSSNVDDQTLHELYLWPFQETLLAEPGSVMCSYNRINNTYACSNSKTLNGILKGELDYQGLVVSDWGGQHDYESVNAGLDLAMPTSPYWDNNQLANAVNNGSLNRTRLVDMATRIVAAWYKVGHDKDFPELGAGLPHNLLEPHEFVDARDKSPAFEAEILNEAIEGHVLLKNTNNALPLKSSKIISVFGYDAIEQTVYDPAPQSIAGQSLDTFSLAWQGVTFSLTQLIQFASNSPVSNAPETYAGTLFTGGGSGSNSPSFISTPYDAIRARANGTQIFHDFVNTNPNVVATSEACLVFINEWASEAFDRPGLADNKSDSIVTNVASKCNNTIVVIHNVGVRVVDAFAENPNVTAIVFAHLPGQEAGNAIAKILFGDVSPSGRLPYTVAKNASDYGDLVGPCTGNGLQCDFTEGVEIDYRSFLARNVTPRYEFGYGLTYSSFEYSSLGVSVSVPVTSASATAPVYVNGTTNQNNGTASVGEAGLTSLWDNIGNITATVANTGSVQAAEVAQLYLTIPGAKTKTLRGFQKVNVQPGSSAKVSFPLRRKDVSRWDTTRQAWVVPSGTFEVAVGKSVLDVPLSGSFTAS